MVMTYGFHFVCVVLGYDSVKAGEHVIEEPEDASFVCFSLINVQLKPTYVTTWKGVDVDAMRVKPRISEKRTVEFW